MNCGIEYTASEIAETCRGKIFGDRNILIREVKTDSRSDCTGSLFIPLKGEKFDGHDFVGDAIANGAVLVCIDHRHHYLINLFKDRGCSWIEVDDTLTAYQELAFAHRRKFKELKIIALTGSCGKTSTKEILKTIFLQYYSEDKILATEGNTNNHVGVPKNLLRLCQSHKIGIIEIGTNHFGEIEPLTKIASPDIAIITSIAPCHTEFFGDVTGVAREKCTIFKGLHKNGKAVIPYECPSNEILRQAVSLYGYVTFGVSPKSSVRVKYLRSGLTGSLIKINFNIFPCRYSCNLKTGLLGEHQALNAGAAAAASYLYGVPYEIICKGISECKMPDMRTKIYRNKGIIWINDAYNANPSSMKAGLRWLADIKEQREGLILVLGDMLELGEITQQAHEEIIKYAEKIFLNSGVKNFPSADNTYIFLVGENMCHAFENMKVKNERFILVADEREATKRIKKYLRQNCLVYLKASRGIGLENLLYSFM